MIFFKKRFTFSNSQRIEFEKYLIETLEFRPAWAIDKKKLTWPGMPHYKFILFVDADGLINVYAHFDKMIKIEGKGKGNTIWIRGLNGIYETFISYFNAETIGKLIDQSLQQPLN